jgi:hypothetical protein
MKKFFQRETFQGCLRDCFKPQRIKFRKFLTSRWFGCPKFIRAVGNRFGQHQGSAVGAKGKHLMKLRSFKDRHQPGQTSLSS